MAFFTRSDPSRVHLRTAPWPSSAGGGRGGARRAPLRALGRPWAWAASACVAIAGTLAGVELSGGPTTYPVSAVFARAPGLFPGAAVDVLGVPIGTVTSVRPVGDQVTVGLAIDHGRAIPGGATASLVSPELLGEPSIELAPGYTGGPVLASGAVIPMTRTAVPVSTEQMLKALDRTLRRVDPKAVGGLITNLAEDLNGQGKNLNTLISGAAGTLRLLATKADSLGRLNGSLAQLTGTLDARTAQITQLITDYDTVSGVIASHSSQLGGAVVQLSQASTELVHVLVPNLGPVEADVGTVTTLGRTIDRNLTSIDGVFASATRLFTGARRVYTPTYNWLTLNSQNPTGLTAAILATQVRHRLAGVCRRILAHHAAGLSATQVKTLETCGNPRSAYFDAIVSQIPSVLRDVREGKTPQAPSAAQMFKKGIAAIPGAHSAKPGTTTSPPPAGNPAPGSSTPPATTGTGGNPSTSGSTGSTSSTCLGSLSNLLTCATTTNSPSSASSRSANTLSAYKVPLASSTPSLRASSSRFLPPLPAAAPGARRAPYHERRHRAHGTRRRSLAGGGLR